MLLALLAAIGAGAIDYLPAAANASLPVNPQPGLLHLFVLVVTSYSFHEPIAAR
jgi:hypothetical protein